MTSLAALVIAALALALSGAGAWAYLAWRNSRAALEILADRLYVDSRLESMTAQTLWAMREAARRAGGAE